MFHIAFLRKTNQKSCKSIFNFYFYKTYQNRIRHNLLRESEQVSLDLLVRVFDLFFLSNFDHITIVNLVSALTCFLLVFFHYF